MEAKADIALIGLAVMGQNLILNMADHGYKVVAFNRTVSKVDEFLNDAAKGHPNVIGAHSIEVPIACEKAGLNPDYYVKTMHHDRYWSAHPREKRLEWSIDGSPSPDHDGFHDNMFDLFPERTVEIMAAVQKPWVAFKVLAGGAIHPRDGFQYAFDNGADFICVGMFDFQIVEDVNIALEALSKCSGIWMPFASR